MPKPAKSSLLSTEVTRALQLAQAALAAALEQKKPPPPRKVERPKIAKVAAGPTKRPPKRGFRGTPPPADFSLAELPDDSLLTEYEVAAVARLSTNTLGLWRQRPDHPLKWIRVGGWRIRYRVASVRQYLATGHRPRPGRPRKIPAPSVASAPKAPKRTPAKPPARHTKTAEHSQDSAPPQRRADSAADERPEAAR